DVRGDLRAPMQSSAADEEPVDVERRADEARSARVPSAQQAAECGALKPRPGGHADEARRAVVAGTVVTLKTRADGRATRPHLLCLTWVGVADVREATAAGGTGPVRDERVALPRALDLRGRLAGLIVVARLRQSAVLQSVEPAAPSVAAGVCRRA